MFVKLCSLLKKETNYEGLEDFQSVFAFYSIIITGIGDTTSHKRQIKSNVDEEATSVSRITRHQVSYVNSLTLVLTVSLHLVSTKFVYTKCQLRVYTIVERRSTTFVVGFSTQLSRSCSYTSLPFFATGVGTTC
jgi:hypothetical protein